MKKLTKYKPFFFFFLFIRVRKVIAALMLVYTMDTFHCPIVRCYFGGWNLPTFSSPMRFPYSSWLEFIIGSLCFCIIRVVNK